MTFIVSLQAFALAVRFLHFSLSLCAGDYHDLEPQLKLTKPALHVSNTFELPLSSSYIGVFVGSGGKHLKELCSKYKVKVHLGGERRKGRGRYVHLTGDTVKVSISYESNDNPDVNGFKEEMFKRAKEVSLCREKHLANVSSLIYCTEENVRTINNYVNFLNDTEFVCCKFIDFGNFCSVNSNW